MNNEQWTHRILEHRTAVSDTVSFTHSEAPNSCYSPDRGMFYTVYTASRRCYGEAHEVVALVLTPVCQPNRFQTRIIAERGVTPGLENVKKIIGQSCFYYTTDEGLYNVKTHFGKTADIFRGYVRITLSLDGDRLYYTDYDIVNDSFSEMKPLNVLYKGQVQPFTGEVFRNYLADQGFHDFNSEEKGETLILTDKFHLHSDGYRYTLATAAWAWPALMRLKAGSDIMEFVGVIPQCAQYEAQSALLDDRIYAILRGSKGDNLMVSDDWGKTFRGIGRIEFNTTRPQLLTHDGELLIGVSLKGILPNRVRDGRNNLRLLRGKGDDLTGYKEVFMVTDPLGMVYYDIQDYKGFLYMFWSSADLYVDKNPQAKDLIWYVRLG